MDDVDHVGLDERLPEAMRCGARATRRQALLLTTAGVTAARGIFLAAIQFAASGAMNEAEAKAGSLGGKLGGRHGKNRRGSKPHGNRDHNGPDKDDNDRKRKKKRGGGAPDDGGEEPRAEFEVTFANQRNRPVAVEVWEHQSAGRKWVNHLGMRRVAPAEEFVARTEAPRLAARIGRDRVVVVSVETATAQEVEATAFIATGRWGASGWDPVGTVLAEDNDLGGEESIAAGGVRLARDPFVIDRLRLRVELT